MVSELTELPFDGERFIPGMGGAIELEHLHRYALAVEIAAGKIVLDIASGEGYGSHMLARVAARVIGVDLSAAAVDHARATYHRDNLEFRIGSCAAIPVEDSAIDLVVSFETIEHHGQHEEMMSEIRRVLKSDGALLISSPNKHEYSDVPGFSNPFHVKELYLDEFTALLGRYFSTIEFYGQRTMHASTIARLAPAPQHLEHRFAETFAQREKTLSRPVYFIALASNAGVPALPMSLMEASLPQPIQPGSVLADASRVQVYWRGSNQPFSEARSVGLSYPVGADAREHALYLPADSGGITTLRIDIADRPLVASLYTLEVQGADGGAIWTWRKSDNELLRAMDCFFIASPPAGGAPERTKLGLDVVSIGNDPRFEIDLPPAASAKLAEGGSVLIKFASRRLLPGYLIDLRSTLAAVAATKDELVELRTAVSATVSNLTAALREAQQQAALRQEALARAERRAALAEDALSRAEQRAAVAQDALDLAERQAAEIQDALSRAEQRWARLRAQRWWSLLNRVFRLESQ